MFGVKLNRNSIRQAIGKTKDFMGKAIVNTKDFMGKAYSTSQNVLSNVDSGIRTAKQVYSILAPTLQATLGEETFGKANKYAMKGLSQYDTIRNQVIDSNENISHNYRKVVGELQKHKIDIGL